MDINRLKQTAQYTDSNNARLLAISSTRYSIFNHNIQFVFKLINDSIKNITDDMLDDGLNNAISCSVSTEETMNIEVLIYIPDIEYQAAYEYEDNTNKSIIVNEKAEFTKFDAGVRISIDDYPAISIPLKIDDILLMKNFNNTIPNGSNVLKDYLKMIEETIKYYHCKKVDMVQLTPGNMGYITYKLKLDNGDIPNRLSTISDTIQTRLEDFGFTGVCCLTDEPEVATSSSDEVHFVYKFKVKNPLR